MPKKNQSTTLSIAREKSGIIKQTPKNTHVVETTNNKCAVFFLDQSFSCSSSGTLVLASNLGSQLENLKTPKIPRFFHTEICRRFSVFPPIFFVAKTLEFSQKMQGQLPFCIFLTRTHKSSITGDIWRHLLPDEKRRDSNQTETYLKNTKGQATRDTLPETNGKPANAPENRPFAPKGNNRILKHPFSGASC